MSAVATAGLTRRVPCLECQAMFEQPARPCQPFLTCSEPCRNLRRRRQSRDEKRRRIARERVELLRFMPSGAGPRFTLAPDELAECLEYRGRGWSTEALATRFGVSTRTVQRAYRLGLPEYVKIGRYGAWFAPQQEGPPVQLTTWRRERAEATG